MQCYTNTMFYFDHNVAFIFRIYVFGCPTNIYGLVSEPCASDSVSIALRALCVFVYKSLNHSDMSIIESGFDVSIYLLHLIKFFHIGLKRFLRIKYYLYE